MKLLKNIFIGFLSLFNYPYISNEVLSNLKGPILLHISDTPVDIYRYIIRIIDILKPQYIVHTGDMVDNIKLEINRNRYDSYYKGVAKLIESIEKNEYSKIYYALGNHDDYETVKHLAKRGVILQEELLTIENCSFTISHYHKEYLDKVDFNLFGHSFVPIHYQKKGAIGLNGLLNINIIDLTTKEVFQLDYPVGTNRLRGMEIKKIGI